MTLMDLKRNKGTIKAHDAQLEFLNLKSRFIGFIAGIGSGKTVAGAIWTLMKAMEEPDRKGIVATRTYPLLRDVVIATVKEVVPDEFVANYNKNESIMEFVNGSKVYFRPLETPALIDRIRGYTVNFVWVDEAAYISYYAIKVLNGRMRQGKNQQIAITTTPKGFNWVFEKFEEPERKIPKLEDELNGQVGEDRRIEIEEKLEDLRNRRQEWNAIKAVSTSDNPFLPDEYVQSIRSQYSGDYFEQEINAQFVKFQGLIYKEFVRDIHVVPVSKVEDMAFEGFFLGYDSGYRNPRVAVKVGRTEDDRFVVTDEFFRVEATLSQSIPVFKRMGAENYIMYCDPSAKGDIEEMKAEGITARPADNEVTAGIQYLKTLLDGGKLLVSEACQNTINEFGTYQWKGDEDNPKDEPLKEHDHAMDALRYALQSSRTKEIPFATL